MRKVYFFLLFLVVINLMLGSQTRDLNQVLQELKGTLQWHPLRGLGYLDVEGPAPGSAFGRVIFKIDAPWIIIDYHYLLSTPGIRRQQGTILFPAATVRAIQEYLKEKAERTHLARVAVILIDPGHGGKDPGAIGYHTVGGKTQSVVEKELVLKVGLELHDLLRRQFPDKKILLTRQGDSYLKLEERTRLANKTPLGDHEAIIFVSIHANASFNKKARGFEVWYLPPDYRRDLINPESLEEESQEIAPILNVLLEEEYTIESITLAKEILAGFEQHVGELTDNRGLKEESWFVVRNAKMPSVLIELGFVTHPEEGARLKQQDYLHRMTLGLYTGIRNFIYRFERSRGFTE